MMWKVFNCHWKNSFKYLFSLSLIVHFKMRISMENLNSIYPNANPTNSKDKIKTADAKRMIIKE